MKRFKQGTAKLRKLYWTLTIMMTGNYVFAAEGMEEFKQNLSNVFNILMYLAMGLGAIMIIHGTIRKRNSEDGAGLGEVKSGAIIAAAFGIMKLLFSIFLPDGTEDMLPDW